MKRLLIALAATSLLAGAAAAQDFGGRGMRDAFTRGDFGDRGFDRPGWDRGGRMGMGRFTPEDVEAFTDARIAALHAGLKLNADQERLWPPVEQAIRDLVKMRREQGRAFRERREQGGADRDDLPGFLRGMAERQGARAAALGKLADAATPLYASFDDGQKRRLRVLMRQMRPHGMRHAWRMHSEGGDDDFGRRGMMGRDGMDREGFGRGGRRGFE
jgi:zinc resistance-associated protein